MSKIIGGFTQEELDAMDCPLCEGLDEHCMVHNKIIWTNGNPFDPAKAEEFKKRINEGKSIVLPENYEVEFIETGMSHIDDLIAEDRQFKERG